MTVAIGAGFGALPSQVQHRLDFIGQLDGVLAELGQGTLDPAQVEDLSTRLRTLAHATAWRASDIRGELQIPEHAIGNETTRIREAEAALRDGRLDDAAKALSTTRTLFSPLEDRSPLGTRLSEPAREYVAAHQAPVSEVAVDLPRVSRTSAAAGDVIAGATHEIPHVTYVPVGASKPLAEAAHNAESVATHAPTGSILKQLLRGEASMPVTLAATGALLAGVVGVSLIGSRLTQN